jgi:cysteine desulfurase family protein (TIGR01976 family)
MPSAAATPDQIAAIRSAFVSLTRLHAGRPVAYFDGPGGTQVPEPVVAAMADYLRHHNANTHWRYPTSAETDAMLAAARGAFADLFACAPADVSFGANMSTITFHLARAIARGCAPGDEIVVTALDHHANVDPWRAAARDHGLSVRTVRLDPQTTELDWRDLESAIGERTKVLAIGAASNALGTINDVARAAALARAAGALTFVDAVHYTPHALVDVAALGCDFLACSAYKFYGPHVGVLYGRAALIAELDVPKLRPAPDAAPDRLETGTQNHEGIAGAAAAVEFLARIGGDAPGQPGARRTRLARAYALLHAHGDALLARLWHGLSAVPGVRLFGRPPGQPRTPTVAFTVAGRDAGDVAAHLASRAVFVSHGDFYATTVADTLGPGPGGFVRAGCACYTTEEEVDRLIEGVRELAR